MASGVIKNKSKSLVKQTITKTTDSEGYLNLSDISNVALVSAYYYQWTQPCIILTRTVGSDEVPYLKWYIKTTGAIATLPASTSVTVTVFYYED